MQAAVDLVMMDLAADLAVVAAVLVAVALAADGERITIMFNKAQRKAILAVIKKYGANTTGLIHVHVRKRCKGDVVINAQQYFIKRGLNKSPQHNGVLIFIAEKSRRFAIIGATAIHAHVQQAFWDNSRDILATNFKQEKYCAGVIGAVEEIGKRLVKHFPKNPHY